MFRLYEIAVVRLRVSKIYKKGNLHIRNRHPDDGCLVRPKHVALPAYYKKVLCVDLSVLLLRIDPSLPTSL
jgi:hypothetical protein